MSSSNYGGMAIVDTKYDYPAVEYLMTPDEVVEYVTASVGASKVRDSVDTQLVDEVQSWGADGALISDEDSMGGAGDLDGGSAPTDSDGDGIPDDVEAEIGSDPNTADAMEIHESGYTFVEAWANSLVPSSYH